MLLRRALSRRSLWDIDLLFRDERALRSFMEATENTDARIVHYDEELILRPGISSLHTAWRFERAWVNVDYILRDRYYEFYAKGRTGREPFRERKIHGGKSYEISLYVAHPWDVFIDKMLSPRFEKELESKNSMGVDVRHVFLLLRRYGERPEFWTYVYKRVPGTVFAGKFTSSLKEVLRLAPEIAGEGIGPTERAWNALNELERKMKDGGTHA